MKQCIFYLPYKLDEHGAGARMMRPRKMAQAFQDIGYEVVMISGTSSERRGMIHDVKKRIKSGEKYDFLYMENHTEPTLLTDPSHLPTHPFMDYGFLKFARKHGIPIGMFYCDVFWKFDFYGADLPTWKKQAALACYRYDVREYEKLLDIFYCPNAVAYPQKIGSEKLGKIARVLLPGAEDIPVPAKKRTDEPLTVFYVGGITLHYRIEELLKAICMTEGTQLILCCRKNEWESEQENFTPYMCDRVEVVHCSGDELEELYARADVGALMFEENEYMCMTVPYKAYEYLGHELPVMSTKGTIAGSFVEKNDIGWNIAYSAKAIQRVFREIFEDPALLPHKQRNCKIAKEENLWTCRAEQVVRDLVK